MWLNLIHFLVNYNTKILKEAMKEAGAGRILSVHVINIVFSLSCDHSFVTP